MENTHLRHEARLEYRNFTNPHDKPYYAAWLNTAKQNVFIILKDLSDKLGQEMKDDDHAIIHAPFWEVLRANDEIYAPRIISHLENHFGFLKHVMVAYAQAKSPEEYASPLPEDYLYILQKWISQLLHYRNYYTHYAHDPVSTDHQIIYDMRGLFYADWQEFKKRKNLSDDQVKHLDGRDQKGREKSGFIYAFQKSHALTEIGFLYFTCLWLEKREAHELLKKHKGFKDSRENYQKATLEKFTWFSLHLPKPRVVSQHTTQGLFLDMVNELQKCPGELYPLLSSKDQKLFDKTNEDEGEPSDEIDSYENKPILRRHEIRFYYFAMRYLEQGMVKLKFPVDLGNACVNQYTQEIGGTSRQRQWMQRIIGYGNLTHFDTEQQPEAWKQLTVDPADTPQHQTYLTKTTPHYHFDASGEVMVIGMKAVSSNDPSAVWPQLTLDPAGHLTSIRNDPPDYWLSLYELPAMAFYHILSENDGSRKRAEETENPVEKVIFTFQKNFTGFLNAISEGTITPDQTSESLETLLQTRGLKSAWIPKPILKYLLGSSAISSRTQAQNRLMDMLKETRERLERHKRKARHYEARVGSKDYIPMKSGHMADYLAEDMVRLQPALEQDQGKANSTEYQVLQSQLAYFGRYKYQLQETFQLCNLIGSKNPHPFLHKLEETNCQGIYEYYQMYLEEKERFLEKCIKNKAPELLHFLKVKTLPLEISTLIYRQLSAVMNLPRGLFEEPIQQALSRNSKTRPLANTLRSAERVNIAYTIQQYFSTVEQDAPQAFYSFPREYPLINKLFDKRKNLLKEKTPPRFSFTPQELTSKMPQIQAALKQRIAKEIKENKDEKSERISGKWQKQYKHFTENEKQIRLHKICDQVLWLMVRQLYQQLEGDPSNLQQVQPEGTFRLQQIQPNSDRSILGVGVPMTASIKDRQGKLYKLYEAQMKVKNYGNFRRLLKDRRVVGLLAFTDARTTEERVIPAAVIRRELEFFEDERVRILAGIHQLEAAVIKKYRLSKNEKGYISHSTILDQLTDLSREKRKQLEGIRSMVCHSQYPDRSLFQHVSGRGLTQLEQYGKEQREIRSLSVIVQLAELADSYYTELVKALKAPENEL